MAITRTATPGRSNGTLEVKRGVQRKTPTLVLRKGVFTLLIRGGLRLSWVDFDAALEVGAVLDADARRGNISDD